MCWFLKTQLFCLIRLRISWDIFNELNWIGLWVEEEMIIPELPGQCQDHWKVVLKKKEKKKPFVSEVKNSILRAPNLLLTKRVLKEEFLKLLSLIQLESSVKHSS